MDLSNFYLSNWILKNMKTAKLIALFILTCHIGMAQPSQCDYFGLEKPGTLPQRFNPPILELNASFIFNAMFSPNCDEIYYTKVDARENIYFSKKVDGKWQAPKIASFSTTGFNDADPFFDPDGNRIYFISARPIDASDTEYDYNIWYADREGKGWSKPTALPSPINTDYEEYFFSISSKGNGFFASNRPGGVGSFDIYQVKVSEDGSMTKPKNVGEPLNTSGYEFDPHISLDESFMIFSINKNGSSDIYFSYKDRKGEWVKAIELGDKINTSGDDFAPSLTPDNKHFIYTNQGALKWVSTDLLDDLKQ